MTAAPAEELSDAGLPEARDWRLRFSLWVTVGWLFLGALYISGVVGWAPFVQQRAPDLGGFLEGAFAPLAFLWLVVGFFLQRQQLEQNTQAIEAQLVEMRRAAEQAEVQSRAIEADELHSRQDTFLRVAEMVNEQLATICGFLVTSVLMELGEEHMSGVDGVQDLWSQTGKGDHTAFDRKIFSLRYGGSMEPAEIFWGTEIRSNHSRDFARAFERLLRHADHCDPDGIISDALRQGSHGRTYRAIQETAPGQAQ